MNVSSDRRVWREKRGALNSEGDAVRSLTPTFPHERLDRIMRKSEM